MFEAFVVNKQNATGVIQWMLNSAFPNMLWQLYDWYLMPTGAYYGTKAALQPVNIIYNYGDKISNKRTMTSKDAEYFTTKLLGHSIKEFESAFGL